VYHLARILSFDIMGISKITVHTELVEGKLQAIDS